MGNTLLPGRDLPHEHIRTVLHHALTAVAVLYHILLAQGLLGALGRGASCVEGTLLAGQDREPRLPYDASVSAPVGGLSVGVRQQPDEVQAEAPREQYEKVVVGVPQEQGGIAV